MMRKICVNIARLVVAVTFILSGFVKAVDPVGTQYKITDYLTVLHLGQYIPDFMTLTASVLLSAAEFWLGVCLLFAIRRRVVTRIILGWLLILTPLTLWLAIANPISDCGCFGDALVLTNWQTFCKNAVLLTCALLIAWHPLDMLRFVSRTNQWIVMNFTALFILLVSGNSLYDLPYFDFRPYHVGTDLRKGWQQMMDGEDSPYTDFFIERQGGDDITDSLLHLKGYTFLLVSPHLEQADESQFDKINEIFEYAQEHGYAWFGLTASNGQVIERWRVGTGAEYEFCLTDDIVLKTMIRSNPGLVLLNDGKIIRKWSVNKLSDVAQLTTPLEKSEIGQMPSDSVPGKIMMIILWYVLPLFLLALADRFWAWSKWIKKKEKSNKLYQILKRKDMRKKIVAGNWKMNLNLQEGVALAKELNEALAADKPNCGVVICTPFIHLASVAQVINQDVIGLGAENCADKEKGAFTGEVSAEMVKSTGAQYVILGHSERREPSSKAAYSTSLRLTSATSLSPTNLSGLSVLVRQLPLSRLRRFTPISALSSLRSMVRLLPTTPASSTVEAARPATLPSCLQSPISTVA